MLTLINVVGLAIGLVSFLLICLYVMDEWQYDLHHKNANRIYRINSDLKIGGSDLHLATCSDPMGPTLKSEYPQVENFVRFYTPSRSKLFRQGSNFVEETATIYADSTLLDIFSIPLLSGNTATTLREPNTVIISASSAKKYFGSTEVLGKSIETNDPAHPLHRITAVFEDMPRTSHFHFDFIFPMLDISYPWGNFLSHNFQTYVLLRDGTDYQKFQDNFSQVIQKHIVPQAQQLMDISSMEEFERTGNKLDYSFMPLTDIHLQSNRHPELGQNGDIKYVWMFSLVAIFILVLACVNFTNLTIAQATSRSKEVSIQKILGSKKKRLIIQFLIESILVISISFVIALVAAPIALTAFNTLSGKMLQTVDLFRPQLLVPFMLFTVIAGILAGLYPALFLSAFNPIAALKGKVGGRRRKHSFRNSLVIFQFITSIVLICATIVIYQQLHFIQQKKIGFDKEQVLIVNNTNALGTNAETFRHTVSEMSAVESASFAGYLPVANSARSDMPFSRNMTSNDESVFNAQIWNIDYNYIPTLGMTMTQGRNFSPALGSDSTGIIINETAAKLFGSLDPLGEKMYMLDTDGSATTYTILGVIEDFHYSSLREQVGPLCMRLGYNRGASAFRIAASEVTETLKQINTKWGSLSATMPFSYYFLDDAFDSIYRTEQRVGAVALTFSVLAILIACLGLLGLTTFIVKNRVKEIGIRKVLGASGSGIVTMLSKDFLKVVLIAILIASPIAWWAMNKWLEDFAYRIEIQWWMFAIAGLLAVLVALATISYQAIRAAIANPVDSLRDE
ncbi:ABC transporter permease [Sphingobacterium sp. lm-10]|uniref:ABC transporter permease n=1 Tax=Sphingobacterium sp. lm-10 TaxID=2944904 RepID=UPI0020224F69|nr:ABC transporter permease [Sphingobacterium sp. lm-10]MCL7988096.1 ABC transporter permease [Sphingobacterium sp. lm-10]